LRVGIDRREYGCACIAWQPFKARQGGVVNVDLPADTAAVTATVGRTAKSPVIARRTKAHSRFLRSWDVFLYYSTKGKKVNNNNPFPFL
jgi:hypothetical protein